MAFYAYGAGLIETMSDMEFKDLPLIEPLQRALEERKYTEPSPIQAQAIPLLLEGRDLLACAQTGTGKTAAFALPILNRVVTQGRKPFRRGVRNLVLVPTRELAVQVTESFRTYGKHLDLKIAMIYGGVSQTPQTRDLYFGLDILVATTGRLLDLLQQGHANLTGVECLVLDEADRMLAMGFIDDLREIVRDIPKERQTMLFSATMAKGVGKLAEGLLNDPERIRIDPEGTTAEKIDQSVLFVRLRDKPALLLDLLHSQYFEKQNELCMIFTRTKRDARLIATHLNRDGIRSDTIHGDRTQAAREDALRRFKLGETPVLVATDVAARGIDVKNIGLVINYDLPMDSENYVHRIGRTARAGESGKAMSLCTEIDQDVSRFKAIEKLTKQTLPTIREHDFHDEAIEALHREGTPLPDEPDRRPARGVRSAAKRSPKKGDGRSEKKSKGVSGAKAAKEKRSGRPFRGFGRGRP
ncbi:DEAD/DEAH box helicase [Lentimonas sp. CC10]|uniref:DEAD/DEAH box helicase n=2 Tax=Lentimonas TaxID=417293 RepID=UPI001324740C|nr:DEAD/DEAH box helicase [Lentimonas sp. CC10]CAA6693720.1 ATP-dependent RNA helicase RhlE [Lentimonas sp. CC10]CAA6696364.1 ATP-dependent RNA helicase RhlE [Lentimonas sp. CC19]CAA7071651.1 ATP-dependent RNA helicase RhlE [Lentimonas sp. CC11]